MVLWKYLGRTSGHKRKETNSVAISPQANYND
jgi:hypothetical protein